MSHTRDTTRRRAQHPAHGQVPAYWDGILQAFEEGASLDPWRAYMRRVYGRLVSVWLPTTDLALKTDLFEEAITDHHVLGELGPGNIGIDCSLAIADAARKRLGGRYRVVVGDLRSLPFRARCLGRILAGSSLDHFAEKREIDIALAELIRVLEPGGVLVVTFDNPHNPAVWLRNRMPFWWLNRI